MIPRRSLLLLVAGLLAGCGKPESPSARPADRPVFLARAETVGTSMLPTFSERETVGLELCAFSDLRPRDTVIYWHDGARQYIHHRLLYRDQTDGRWVTGGDNNPGRDSGRMTADEFIGRTRKLVP